MTFIFTSTCIIIINKLSIIKFRNLLFNLFLEVPSRFCCVWLRLDSINLRLEVLKKISYLYLFDKYFFFNSFFILSHVQILPFPFISLSSSIISYQTKKYFLNLLATILTFLYYRVSKYSKSSSTKYNQSKNSSSLPYYQTLEYHRKD